MSVNYFKLAAICEKNNLNVLSQHFLFKYSQAYQEVPQELRYAFMKAVTPQEIEQLVKQYGFASPKAFRNALSIKFHPDVNADEPEMANDLTRKLNNWYDWVTGKDVNPPLEDLYQKWNVKFNTGTNQQTGTQQTAEEAAANNAQATAEEAATAHGATAEEATAAGQKAAEEAAKATGAANTEEGAAAGAANAERVTQEAAANAAATNDASKAVEEIATVPGLGFLSKFSKSIPFIGLLLSIPSVVAWIQKINAEGIDKALADPADKLNFISLLSGTVGTACLVIPPLVEIGSPLVGLSFITDIASNVESYLEHPEKGLKLFGLIPLIGASENEEDVKTQKNTEASPDVAEALKDATMLFIFGGTPSTVANSLKQKYPWLNVLANQPGFEKRQAFANQLPTIYNQVKGLSPDQIQQLKQKYSDPQYWVGITPLNQNNQTQQVTNKLSYTPKPTHTLPGFETLDSASLTLFGKPWKEVDESSIINQLGQMFNYMPVNTGNYDHDATQNEYLRQYLQEAKRQGKSIAA